MSTRNLEALFRPKSVAVVGASDRKGSVGFVLMRNLLDGGFSGTIMPVNPRHDTVGGIITYKNVAELPRIPDIGLIATPSRTVPDIIEQLGKRGARAAVVLTSGMEEEYEYEKGTTLEQEMLERARPFLLRILGPNWVGLIVPGIGFNGSFAHSTPSPGKLAFVTQSGALATSVLDWANTRDIGFSHFISLGNSADVDFGDTLDYLASDPKTKAIMLHIESVEHARKFMSAGRAAARNKPVVVVKSGRSKAAAKAAATHTGALAGSDAVYEAAFRRTGMLRVYEIEDLFNSVETLARASRFSKNSLTIFTNGGGPGVMATDALNMLGGELTTLSEETIRQLDEILPSTWSHENPVDIIGDAPVERYIGALRVLLAAPECASILFIHSPTAIVAADDIAKALVNVISDSRHNVLACWLGGQGLAQARSRFLQAGIPSYNTPENGVGAFMQMVGYQKNQELLLETPPSIPTEFDPDIEDAKEIIEQALERGKTTLSEPESKKVLACYGIPIVDAEIAKDAEEAINIAENIGPPVAVKILSDDISHKSDVGGVALDLETHDDIRHAIEEIEKRAKKLRPDADLAGFTVQKMERRLAAVELIAGATNDAVFGPTILFGQGGTAVEVIGDRAVALPPLNMKLARDLVDRTRISKILKSKRDHHPADMGAIYLTLIQLSKMVSDIPQIVEIDINPLLANQDGVVSLDARITVSQTETEGPSRLAIRPYPEQLEEEISLSGMRILLRPIRPEDERAHRRLFTKFTKEDIYFRFHGPVRSMSHSQMARLTQIDYDREMAFIAVVPNDSIGPETLGVSRIVADPDNYRAEFAIIVRSDFQGRGLGRRLAEKTIRYAKERGIKELRAFVLRGNTRMTELARTLGFELADDSEIEEMIFRLSL